MTEYRSSRRDVLRAGAAVSGVVTLGSLAGCSTSDDPEATPVQDTFDGSVADMIDRVPADADVVATVDAETVVTDPGVERVVTAGLRVQAAESSSVGAENFDEFLDEIETNLGLDPRAASELTPFFEWDAGSISEEFVGALVTGDWSTADFVDAAEDSGTSLTETEYGGQPVYEPDADATAWLGVLADNGYVVGSETAVTATIDVRNGADDGLSTQLSNAYGETRPGPVRFAGTVPDSLPDPQDIDISPLETVETVAGAAYVDGDTRGIDVSMAAVDAEAAADVVSMTEQALTIVGDETTSDAIESAVNAVTVSQDGSDVAVGYEASVSDLVDVAEEWVTATSSSSTRSDQVVEVPRANFHFEYEESGDDKGTLTITHASGPMIRQAELSIAGDGFTSVSGVDMTSSGQWAGTTRERTDNQPSVAAGNRVTVGVESDYDIRIIWESADGDHSATLAAAEGPDA